MSQCNKCHVANVCIVPSDSCHVDKPVESKYDALLSVFRTAHELKACRGNGIRKQRQLFEIQRTQQNLRGYGLEGGTPSERMVRFHVSQKPIWLLGHLARRVRVHVKPLSIVRKRIQFIHSQTFYDKKGGWAFEMCV
jgi:hypothetical protein